MLKKIWKFLNAPLFDLVAGLFFYVLVAFWIHTLGDTFDVQSALIGVCGVISLNTGSIAADLFRCSQLLSLV